MTVTDTTTGQLVLDAEQAEAVLTNRKASYVDAVVDAALGEKGRTFPLTLTFDVEPQPERSRTPIQPSEILGIIPSDDVIEDVDYEGKTYCARTHLHAAMLSHWWQGPTSEGGMGNTGSPRAGQRVNLFPQSTHLMERTGPKGPGTKFWGVCRHCGAEGDALVSQLACPYQPERDEAAAEFDRLATATLAAVPRVEQGEIETGPTPSGLGVCIVQGFVVKVEVTP